MTDPGFRPHSSHWGAFSAREDAGTLLVEPHPSDPDPSPLLQNFTDSLRHKARILHPMVRRAWLEHGPAPRPRDDSDFVRLPWPELLDRLAAELARVRDTHGPESIFGGSYGWSSAGRFHHAQSQVHRFLNTALGGYVRSVNSYSAGASAVILPHILGPFEAVTRRNVTWEQIEAHTDIALCFGGLPLKNMMVASGGVSRHIERHAIARAAASGTRFLLVSPLRDDLPPEAAAEWLPITPGTDTALMLALAHTIVTENLHDAPFLARCCTGFDRVLPYLLGGTDGQPKSPAWAAPITGLPAPRIAALARSLPGKRVLITLAQSLQRAEHGEQPVWMAAVLAAILGQPGLPGGGYNYGLGSLAHYGRRQSAVPLPTLPQGRNPVSAFIPVARIADMLLHPGDPFDYNGQRLPYPHVRLVYWAGGNPFHHHQDLGRLRRAFARPDTIVVHESAWTATARHADIVLPCTLTLERDDIGANTSDPLLIAMHRLADPPGEARDDYAIFSALAARLGREHAFTEGRTAAQWLRHLYATTEQALRAQDLPAQDLLAPGFDAFWSQGELLLPQAPDDGGLLRAFRDDPAAAPLPTPSGRIELYSETIAAFGYPDCPGHPAWLPPTEPPDVTHPLHLISNQPATRLHSQLDFAAHSAAAKHRGREVARLNPSDAAARGIAEGDIIRLHNPRGACLAAATLSDALAPGIVQLATGAWFDPEPGGAPTPTCVHGNPNVLTRDIGTSRLAQGCTGQLTTVQVERFTGNLPPIRAYDPPAQTSAPVPR